ncbi:hypothetical protein WKI65_38370 [Streptomyces sp. MS1.AVA.3]|uniref:hypothetical protein n=1 Tax=Streptomyces decoyicus TaxID=249567 RepID=UPI0030C571A4
MKTSTPWAAPSRAADVTAITEAAAGPLRSFLEQPGTPVRANILADLDVAHPRASGPA